MPEYLPNTGWDTDVCVANASDYPIHLNGEQFSGPYAP